MLTYIYKSIIMSLHHKNNFDFILGITNHFQVGSLFTTKILLFLPCYYFITIQIDYFIMCLHVSKATQISGIFISADTGDEFM